MRWSRSGSFEHDVELRDMIEIATWLQCVSLTVAAGLKSSVVASALNVATGYRQNMSYVCFGS